MSHPKKKHEKGSVETKSERSFYINVQKGKINYKKKSLNFKGFFQLIKNHMIIWMGKNLIDN